MPVSKSKLVNLQEFLALFKPEVHGIIKTNLAKPRTQGIVCFENLQRDSPNFGARSAVIFGPDCTLKTLDYALSKRLGDVPSRFQYPVAQYVKPPVFDEALKKYPLICKGTGKPRRFGLISPGLVTQIKVANRRKR